MADQAVNVLFIISHLRSYTHEWPHPHTNAITGSQAFLCFPALGLLCGLLGIFFSLFLRFFLCVCLCDFMCTVVEAESVPGNFDGIELRKNGELWDDTVVFDRDDLLEYE